MEEQDEIVGRVPATTTDKEKEQQGQYREGTSNNICYSKEPAKYRIDDFEVQKEGDF